MPEMQRQNLLIKHLLYAEKRTNISSLHLKTRPKAGEREIVLLMISNRERRNYLRTMKISTLLRGIALTHNTDC